MYLKKGDEVMIIAGNDKGKTGVISKILPNNKVIVEGIALCKRHQKDQGNGSGIIEKERAIDASNVSLFDSKTKKPSRIKKEIKNDKKVRILKSNGKEI